MGAGSGLKRVYSSFDMVITRIILVTGSLVEVDWGRAPGVHLVESANLLDAV